MNYIDEVPKDLYAIPFPQPPPLPQDPIVPPQPPPEPSQSKEPTYSPPLPSADIAGKATKELPIDDHEDSDSEGELQIDMESQEAKRRASSGEEAKPDNNINAEDLLEELYGGFEKEESDENS